MLDMLVKTGHVMSEMIEDLLIASRIENGRISISTKDFTPSEIMKQVLHQLENNIQQKDLTYSLDIPVSISIQADPIRIEQVFRILIDIAVKYSPTGNKKEISGLENLPEINQILGVDGILLTIKDNGIGIPPDEIPNLFKRFYRASNVKLIQGTGLGLAIAKELVELHHGRIVVESILGKGTMFKIFLPKVYSSSINPPSNS